MSSIDQAFIKAFARRNRTSQSPSLNTAQSAAISAPPTAEAVPRISNSPTTLRSLPLRSDFLRIDPSVDPSVELWTDPSEERLMRVDAFRCDSIPAPHAAPKTRSPKTDSPIPLAESFAITTDSPSSLSMPAVDLANRVEKTTDQVRSIQDSLDLLQSTFTTLETIALPNEDISKAYIADATSSSPSNQLVSETKPLGFPMEPSEDAEETVLHRFDSPEGDSIGVDVEAKADAVSQADLFGLASTPAESLALRPVWEVDVFDVPTAVADLFFEGPLFQQIAERVLQAVNTGLTSMMVTSVHRGEGRSTVAIGMAMAAAAAGLRVALLDADTEDPTLHDDLRLDLEYGWVDTVRGGLAIREVAVHAVEDGVTLIPLIPTTTGAAATDFEIVQVLQSLRGKFDLIIVDTPSLESSMTQPVATTVDSALIVRDCSRTSAEMINKLSYKLREKGVQGIGVVDNFA